jgi:hypothetical protein
MRNTIKISLFLLAGIIVSATTLSGQDVCLKIGGSYFINCKRTIAFGEQAIMTVSLDDKNRRMVNFDIFSQEGVLDASLKDGKFSGRQANAYVVENIGEGFAVTDTRSKRVVLKVMGVKNEDQKRNELHVWGDFFLPDGGRFQCTPEESNVPMLNMVRGATFKNNETAIQL